MSEHEQISDRDFILNPIDWPNWPILPLKRTDQSMHCGVGFITASNEPWSIVYLGNMFNLESGDLKQQLDKLDQKHYSNINELLADGWIVD